MKGRLEVARSVKEKRSEDDGMERSV